MNNDKTYLEQLKELYETYTGKELEAVLGVTTRSMQNYLKEESPTVPGTEVVRSIREAYAKHIRGEDLTKSPDPLSDQDLQKKYIALLEKNQKLEEKIDRIGSSLKEIPDNMGLLTDLLLKGQESVAQRVHNDLSQVLASIEKMLSKPSTAPGKKSLAKGKH